MEYEQARSRGERYLQVVLFGFYVIHNAVNNAEAMPPKKRKTRFSEDHAVVHGLPRRRSNYFPYRANLLSLWPRATTNFYYFRCPFRSDVFKSHMLSQYSVKWERYAALPKREKSRFFVGSSPLVHRNTIRSHFAEIQVPFITSRTETWSKLSSVNCYLILTTVTFPGREH
jgi:hypothetical protein